MKTFTLLLGAAASLAFASAANATVVTQTYDTQVTVSASVPSGSPLVTFDDMGGTGTVILTIDLNALSGGEFISNFWFNFADAGSTALSISRTGGTGPTAAFITINPVAEDGYNSAGTNGEFDLLIEFATSNAGGGIRRFGADETLTFTITGLGITAPDFDVLSMVTGPNVARRGQMHIQGIADGGSVHVSPGDGPDEEVPEPGMLGLLGLGLIGLGMMRRRR